MLIDREHERQEAEDQFRPAEAVGLPVNGAAPTASGAPTTMTEEIALVTDISGVCSAGVTDQTT